MTEGLNESLRTRSTGVTIELTITWETTEEGKEQSKGMRGCPQATLAEGPLDQRDT